MKPRIIRIIPIILMALLLSISYNANGTERSKVRKTRVTKQRHSRVRTTSQVAQSNQSLNMDDKQFVDKANALAFTLMLKQSKEEPFKSFSFSPLSVSYALAMASNGASGVTLQEIEELIGPSAQANSFYSKCIAHFSPSVVMSTCLAMNNGIIINSEFTKSIVGFNNVQVRSLNFGTSEAAKQLNDWIKQQSNGEFDNIIEQTNPNELIYLINYLKFKALWKNPFDKSHTWDNDFTNDDGSVMQVPMMFQYFRELYYEDNKCQAISMKYDNSEFRMLVVLPKDVKINKFLEVMNVDEFNRITSGLKAPDRTVDLNLPRFSTDCNMNLREMLASLMPTAFDEKADFSRLSKVKSYINRFTQDTKITVNEYGTEASGVTVQSNIFKSINLPFNANHPFLYFIYDESTRAILQAGQYCGN